MPYSKHRDRGPRFIPAKALRPPRSKRILMPHLMGRVVRVARVAANVTQQDVALWLGLPISTLSKLERGDTTMSVYHLDAIAQALTHFQQEDGFDEEEEGWEGWELMQIASTIADSLDSEGFDVFWAPPKREQDPDGVAYIKGRHLAPLVRRLWPEDYRDAVGLEEEGEGEDW